MPLPVAGGNGETAFSVKFPAGPGEATENLSLPPTAGPPTTASPRSLDTHAMGVGTARLRGRTHRVLRVCGVFDCAASWTRLGVCVARGRRPRRQLRGWLACAVGGGGNFD